MRPIKLLKHDYVPNPEAYCSHEAYAFLNEIVGRWQDIKTRPLNQRIMVWGIPKDQPARAWFAWSSLGGIFVEKSETHSQVDVGNITHWAQTPVGPFINAPDPVGLLYEGLAGKKIGDD